MYVVAVWPSSRFLLGAWLTSPCLPPFLLTLQENQERQEVILKVFRGHWCMYPVVPISFQKCSVGLDPLRNTDVKKEEIYLFHSGDFLGYGRQRTLSFFLFPAPPRPPLAPTSFSISRDKRKPFSKLKLWLLSENSTNLILIKDARLESVNEEVLFLVNYFSLSEVKTVLMRGKWPKNHLQKDNRDRKLVWYLQHYPVCLDP